MNINKTEMSRRKRNLLGLANFHPSFLPNILRMTQTTVYGSHLKVKVEMAEPILMTSMATDWLRVPKEDHVDRRMFGRKHQVMARNQMTVCKIW